MGLGDYFRKRRFKKTPEPKGAIKRTPSKKLAFVVQEHHARALHYDFRIEINGVLKSWAIPKGPSLNPHEHHLAIQTEDHPYDYRTFEGVIPEGNYGAGNVIIWDEGWVEARKGNPAESEKTLHQELKKGHLTFIVHGKKLRGEFALIKMQHAENNAWLLVKKTDEFASTSDVTQQNESVRTHRTVDELGAPNKLPDITRYPAHKKPWHVKPMLCTLIEEPFSREDWLFEIKWDGYRAIGTKYSDTIDLYSRNGNDFTTKYPRITEALRAFKHDVIIDGEIVVVDKNGHSHFEWLQSWTRAPHGTLQYFVFDILWCDGRDVRKMPLRQRKALLKSVMPKHSALVYCDDIEKDGLALFHEIQRQGLEGIIAKRADSPYREDVRGPEWFKIKTHLCQEVVIGGYTEPRGTRKFIGALIVGVYEKDGLRYVGHSGGGIPDEQRKSLQAKLARLERRSSPFINEPKPNAPVHWVRPEIVCEMSFSEWTHEGHMRHPQFEGLRIDKNPKQVKREHATRTAPVTAKAHPIKTNSLPFEPTHLDKIFFPAANVTKGDMMKYYTAVAEYILPYLKDRPHSLNRMPNGIKGESFYQKNNEHLPDWVPYTDIFSASNNENLRWMVGGELNTLLYMVQLGCVEINPWNSRVNHLEKPDWAVIDLDPEGHITFDQVIEIAQTVHTLCDEWHLPSYPKTSGKTGIHIYIPLGAHYTYEQAKNLAHLIVFETNKRQPNITSIERMPEKRKNKIYLDFLQNREGQTLAAPYSLRPTPQATVSMPLEWNEVRKGLRPTDFTINNARKRITAKGDIWKPVLGKGIDVEATIARIEKTQA